MLGLVSAEADMCRRFCAGLLYSDDATVVVPDDWPDELMIGLGSWLIQSVSAPKFGLNRKLGVVLDGGPRGVNDLLLSLLLLLIMVLLLLLLLC